MWWRVCHHTKFGLRSILGTKGGFHSLIRCLRSTCGERNRRKTLCVGHNKDLTETGSRAWKHLVPGVMWSYCNRTLILRHLEMLHSYFSFSKYFYIYLSFDWVFLGSRGRTQFSSPEWRGLFIPLIHSLYWTSVLHITVTSLQWPANSVPRMWSYEVGLEIPHIVNFLSIFTKLLLLHCGPCLQQGQLNANHSHRQRTESTATFVIQSVFS